MDYPVIIQSTDYHDTLPVATTRNDLPLYLSRRNYGSKIGNTVNQPECGLESLWLACAGSGKKSKTSYRQAHTPLASQSGDRFHFAPGSETVTIHWKFKRPQYITQAKIELYRKSAALEAPIWCKEINWDTMPCTEAGHTAFDGRIDNYSLAATNANTVAVTTPLGLAFPGNLLTVEHSPYKLKMTITGYLAGAQITRPVRWLYFDVLVKDLTLSFGDGQELDPNRPDLTHTFQWTPLGGVPQTVNLRTLAVQMEAQLLANLGAPTADQPIVLESSPHAFNTNSTVMFGNDEMYRRHKQLWGEGPRLPLYAEVKIQTSDNHAVSQPLALGALQFLWDWEDGVPDKLKKWTSQGYPAETKRFLTNTLKYLVDVETTQGHQPTGSTNCHRDFGGKRGEGATPIFPVQTAAGYNAATAALIPGVFPIPVAACAQRTWAAISQVRCTNFKAGYTGVIFQPSRMAGDTYKVSVWFLPPGATFPYTDNASDLARNVKAPQATTGVLEMRRGITVRYYLQNNTQGCDSNKIKAIYDETGITLAMPPPQPFPPLSFAAAMTQGIRTFLTDPSVLHNIPIQGMLIPPAQPPGVAHALTLRTLNEYLTALQDIDAKTLVKVTLAAALPGVSVTDQVDVVPAGVGAVQQGLVLAIDPANTAILTLAITNAPVVGDQAREVGGITSAINAVQVLTVPEKATFMSDTYRYTTGMTGLQLEQRYTQVRESLTNQILKRFAIAFIDTNHLADTGIFFLHFKTRVNGEVLAQPVTGWAPSDAGEPHRTIFFVTSDYQGWQGDPNATSDFPGRPTRANLKHWKPRDPVIAHEIGHNLCLPHAQGGGATGTAKPDLHLAFPPGNATPHVDNFTHCIMNYHPKALRFCGYCNLRLRGWSAMGEVDPANNDGTVQLQNTEAGNLSQGSAEIIAPNTVVLVSTVLAPRSRVRIGLRVSKPFAGTALLTRSSLDVKVFDVPALGVERPFDGISNVFAAATVRTGRWLYMEGVNAGNVTLTLDPRDGSPPATVVISVR